MQQETKTVILYWSGSEFNLLSKYLIRFTVSNILFDLRPVEEP